MLLLRWGKQKITLSTDETAAILHGSATETKPQCDTENLTIFLMSTVVATNVMSSKEGNIYGKLQPAN
jgi:hypothetical protein